MIFLLNLLKINKNVKVLFKLRSRWNRAEIALRLRWDQAESVLSAEITLKSRWDRDLSGLRSSWDTWFEPDLSLKMHDMWNTFSSISAGSDRAEIALRSRWDRAESVLSAEITLRSRSQRAAQIELRYMIWAWSQLENAWHVKHFQLDLSGLKSRWNRAEIALRAGWERAECWDHAEIMLRSRSQRAQIELRSSSSGNILISLSGHFWICHMTVI